MTLDLAALIHDLLTYSPRNVNNYWYDQNEPVRPNQFPH